MKSRKQHEIRSDPSTISTSTRIKFGVNLQVDVQESESTRALVAKTNDVVNHVSTMLAALAFEAFDLNLKSLLLEKV